MNSKTKQLLVYLIKNKTKVPVTSLMKLCYLVDFLNVKKNKKQISNFNYKRYTYGPFDEGIYTYLKKLVEANIIKTVTDYTLTGEEYISYIPNEDEDFEFNKLGEKEVDIIDEVLEGVKGLGARTLTGITYKTKPMEKLGATQGGNEGLNQSLDLFVK